MSVKRFLVFKMDPRKARGGWEDFRQSFSGYDEAMDWQAKHRRQGEEVQIVDTLTGEVFAVRDFGVEWSFAGTAA